MDKETVRTILVDTLGMRKVCAKMVPRLLIGEQKAQRLNACRDILQQMEADEKLLENIYTGDESWVLQYDPETKREPSAEKCVLAQTKESPHATFTSESDADHVL